MRQLRIVLHLRLRLALGLALGSGDSASYTGGAETACTAHSVIARKEQQQSQHTSLCTVINRIAECLH